MNKLEFLARDLPSPEAARRFFEQFSEQNPSQASRLQKNEGLFSDVLALASYSPLLAATMIQSPEYVSWLGKERMNSAVRSKDELMESLARFELTHSQVEPHVLFARFRRRELLRIFLRDIRRLGTIAVITEEISNLADAILENALRITRQEMDNRYGPAFQIDEKGRKRPSDICIVSLGKLGSKELNYSSDIDLLFIYSADGHTSGSTRRGTVTNREYFIKAAENVIGLVGRQSGEGAAYRVDMRLRPHGRVGALALSLSETVKYYSNDARNWERQVLIRSRSSAGSAAIFKNFFSQVEDVVFEPGREPEQALREVLRSKQKIDEKRSGARFDVKLGRGGIREIEFIAQALQLAYGGTDRWLHIPHSLISISRLADRQYLTEEERSHLSAAYDFLRRLEHVLQMEQGLQTHTLPGDDASLALVAARMGFDELPKFREAITGHTDRVHSAFQRVFDQPISDDRTFLSSQISCKGPASETYPSSGEYGPSDNSLESAAPLQPPTAADSIKSKTNSIISHVSEVSPHFAEMIASRPWLGDMLSSPDPNVCDRDHDLNLSEIATTADRPKLLSLLRKEWSRSLLEIAVADIYQLITPMEARRCQTRLAEASLRVGARAAALEIQHRFSFSGFDPTIIAMGKLGSGTLDYGSDLDVVIAYRGQSRTNTLVQQPEVAEIYSRGVEYLVTLLSSMTRDGNLYRIDLRLRPYGKNGPSVTTLSAFGEYIENEASIWELLAYVQMRAIEFETETPATVEAAIRNSLDRRLKKEDPEMIRSEARTMRFRLEKTHGRSGSERDIDIKFGPGGLLDVYFVVRCLNLIYFDRITSDETSTAARLEDLHKRGLIDSANFTSLSEGHRFLSELEHNIRLMLGRTSRFPRANVYALNKISERMQLKSADNLVEDLNIHRLNIRTAFDDILS